MVADWLERGVCTAWKYGFESSPKRLLRRELDQVLRPRLLIEIDDHGSVCTLLNFRRSISNAVVSHSINRK